MKILESSLVQIARNIAIVAHGDQKYGDHPYVFHLDMVARNLYPYESHIAAILAYLHDVIEDTEVTSKDIRNFFGDYITESVYLLSDPQGPNRKTQKKISLERMRIVGDTYKEALIVKAADRLSNIDTAIKEQNFKLLRMYIQEMDEFERAVYRPGLCDEIWKRINSLKVRAY